RLDEGGLAQTAPDLTGAHPPVPGHDLPQGGGTEHSADVAQVELTPLVAFSCKSEHGVGTALAVPVDPAREVNAQKREGGVGNRIDDVATVMPRRGSEIVVSPAERDDRAAGILPAQSGQAIGLQPATVDHVASANRAGRGFQNQAVAVAPEFQDASAGEDL